MRGRADGERRASVSELRSMIEALRAETLAELPDARVEEDFEELHRAIEQLETERARRLAEIDRRRFFERDGHLSTAAWLVRRLNLAWGAAKDLVRVARELERMPATRRALEAGEVSVSAARVLAATHAAEPEAFAKAEPLLLEAARIHPVADLGRLTARWKDQVARERGVDPDRLSFERRRLHVSRSLDRMVRVDGDLDPETGECLLTALRAVMDAEARSPGTDEDPRTPAQRRADALGEVCRRWLDRPDRPMVAGERPHVTLTVGVETLRSGARSSNERGATGGEATPPAGRAPELDHAGAVGHLAARRIACDADLMRVVLAGASQPLDVGRRTKIVSPALRRAVIVRDVGCRFPGCGRPHAWCDAHHVRHWADGGPTSLENLILLCRRHHRLVHQGGFTMELTEGRAVFRRPDGSALEDRAPP
jgi:hypothetical protein